MNLCVGLLNRPRVPGEKVVIKCSDVVNSMGDALLSANPCSTIAIVSNEIRTFLLSALKSAERRDWTRKRARDWNSRLTCFPLLNSIHFSYLTDAQKAAYVWLVNRVLWQSMVDKGDRTHILHLRGEMISEDPERALRRISLFLGLDSSAEGLSRAALNGSSLRHSKVPDLEYSHAHRLGELRDLDDRLCSEVDHAIDWANHLAVRCGLERNFNL